MIKNLDLWYIFINDLSKIIAEHIVFFYIIYFCFFYALRNLKAIENQWKKNHNNNNRIIKKYKKKLQDMIIITLSATEKITWLYEWILFHTFHWKSHTDNIHVTMT